MKEKILILEDEIGIRSFVSINLKREGYEVIEAGCGQEAIDKIKNEKNIGGFIFSGFCHSIYHRFKAANINCFSYYCSGDSFKIYR